MRTVSSVGLADDSDLWVLANVRRRRCFRSAASTLSAGRAGLARNRAPACCGPAALQLEIWLKAKLAGAQQWLPLSRGCPAWRRSLQGHVAGSRAPCVQARSAQRVWLTDITEHPTREGKIYCAAVLDAFSRLVVGWAIDSTQTTTLVLNALGMATQRRQHRDGLIMRSDRGVQRSR